MSEKRYICIHGHFYQPPRENPWLEAIELQESADPFHDWNERITAECYRPNGAARIQSNDGHILGIVNNYARISYNFGPTVLSWMEHHSPLTYQSIIDADKESQNSFGGHGSAIAQVYNHMIMPLANRRDQETQIIWGLRDFEYRFGRKPEGMWLAEAAVSVETLELLADHGIAFTILAPGQAAAVRPKAANGASVPNAGWENVTGARVDPARAYDCPLPSGKSIALFFYDGPISQGVAFEGILKSGETFAERLISGLSDTRDYPQLLHIATDGETYGHHHKFGDMALAYALHYIDTNELATITNYGQFLELHPPTWEVKIVNNSSWSCSHGVQRWGDNCGCSSGMHPGWSQQWRKPLRQALNWLRDSVNPSYERVGKQYLKDVWAARDAYVDVVLNRTPETVTAFLQAHALKTLSPEDTTIIMQLMELQRQMMLMYTSCGWFFDEISGLETVQIMQYASRAIQLAELSLGLDLESGFVDHLREARSNIPENRNGAYVYEKFVKPARVDLVRVGAHYAVMSLFQPDIAYEHTYAFTVEPRSAEILNGGQTRLSLGRARITSDITFVWEDITYCILHLGDQSITAGVKGAVSPAHFLEFSRNISSTFKNSDLPQTIRMIDQEFGSSIFSLASLFKDERQVILQQLLETNMAQALPMLRVISENNGSLLRFLTSIGAPQPEILRAIGKYVVGDELRQLLNEDVPDPERLNRIVNEALEQNLPLDDQRTLLSVNHAIANRAAQLAEPGGDESAMEALMGITSLTDQLPFKVNLWQAQNVIFELSRTRYIDKQALAAKGDEDAIRWVELFRALSAHLKVNINA